MDDFVGVKIALFTEGDLIVFLRDNKEGLRFANMWDFPGGGREGTETPFECIQREVQEEFGITLSPDQILWQREYPAMHDPSLRAYFMVGQISREQVGGITFGTEGQRWQTMSPNEFLNRSNVVPHLKKRLSDYLARQIAS